MKISSLGLCLALVVVFFFIQGGGVNGALFRCKTSTYDSDGTTLDCNSSKDCIIWKPKAENGTSYYECENCYNKPRKDGECEECPSCELPPAEAKFECMLDIGIKEKCPPGKLCLKVNNVIYCGTKESCKKENDANGHCEECLDSQCGTTEKDWVTCYKDRYKKTTEKCLKPNNGCTKTVNSDGVVEYKCMHKAFCDSYNKLSDGLKTGGKCHFCNDKDLCNGARKSAPRAGFGLGMMMMMAFFLSSSLAG